MAHRGLNWERIEVEIAKCDVRCANCHRRRTTSQFGWAKPRVDLRGLEPLNLSDANRALSQLSYRPGNAEL